MPTLLPELEYLTPEERAHFDMMVTPPVSNAVTLADLKIVDATGNLVSLVLNEPQRILMRELGFNPDDPRPDITLRRMRDQGKALRDIVLKARREGVTTLILALLFLDTYNNSPTYTVSMAHRADDTEAYFQICRTFYDNLPAEKKRPTKHSTRKELVWERESNGQIVRSSIRCGTAGSENFGSGQTIHNLHMSERAKWLGSKEDIARTDASVMEAAQRGHILVETTANGVNHFMEMWRDAESGISNWRPHFLAWWRMPEYRAKPSVEFTRTEEERVRAESYGLDDEQLCWYRLKELERGDLMQQEYPDSPAVAFLSSGRLFLGSELAQWMVAESEHPNNERVMDLRIDETFYRLRREYESGRLTVWVPPVLADGGRGNAPRAYLITADPSGGMPDGDQCSADVWDFTSREQVAHLYGNWEPSVFGELLCELGWLYNTALVAPERNNHGGTVILAMQHRGYQKQESDALSGIYAHDPNLFSRSHRTTNRRNLEMGWPTLETTRQMALDEFKGMLRAEMEEAGAGLYVRSKITAAQALTFIVNERQKPEAQSGAKDDAIMSACIAPLLLKHRYANAVMGKLRPVPPRTLY